MLCLDSMTFHLQKAFHAFKTILHLTFHSMIAKNYAENYFSDLTDKKTESQMVFVHPSVAKSCPTLCHSTDCSRPGFPVHHCLSEFAQTLSIESMMPSSSVPPLPLLPSVFPSIRVVSNELALHIRWPKYWSFSFNISPSNEYSRLISFRIDWFHLLAVQGLSKVFSSTTG